jgi:hypothetical protein
MTPCQQVSSLFCLRFAQLHVSLFKCLGGKAAAHREYRIMSATIVIGLFFNPSIGRYDRGMSLGQRGVFAGTPQECIEKFREQDLNPIEKRALTKASKDMKSLEERWDAKPLFGRIYLWQNEDPEKEAAASLITKGFVWSKSHWRRDLCDEVVLRIRRTREWSHRLPLHRLPSL